MRTDTLIAYDPKRHHAYKTDFGQLSERSPQLIAFPRTAEELQEVVQYARNAKLEVAVRGHAHTTGGQTLVDSGLVIDLKSYYKKVEKPFKDPTSDFWYVDIEAGASWRNVFETVLAYGLTPPVYSDYTELTVGGTLSTGGVGQSSFKKGLQIDQVLELDIIIASGELLTCSPHKNNELFYAVLGGLGYFGIITRVRMQLEQAPTKVLVAKVVFTDIEAFIDAQFRLADRPEIDALQAHITPNTSSIIQSRVKQNLSEDFRMALENISTDWLPILEVTQYCQHSYNSENSDQVKDDFVKMLQLTTECNSNSIFVSENFFSQHVKRIPPILEGDTEKTQYNHYHCCVFVGANEAKEPMHAILERTTQANLGNGTILVIPLQSEKTAASISLPNSQKMLMIAFLRRHDPKLCSKHDIEAINKYSYQKMIEAGATIYAVGSEPPKLQGQKLPEQHSESIKALYDPHTIFSSSREWFEIYKDENYIDQKGCNYGN